MLDAVTTYDDDEKIWKGPKQISLFNENISAGEVALFMMRSKNPQDIMQISDTEGTSLTYGTALTSAIRIAQHFRQLQLTNDDVVGIFAPDTTYVMPVAVAAWLNGTPFQAMNYKMESSVVKNIYNSIKPKIIFCDGLQYDKVKEASSSFKPLIYTLCNHLENVPKIEDLLEPTKTEHFYQAEPLKNGPDQTMVILLSSGTSGMPKGVCFSNRKCTIDYGFTNGSSVLFSTSTIDWSTGMFAFLGNVIIGGTRIITTKPFTPEYLIQIITKYKISFLSTNPEIMLETSLLPNFSTETMQSIRLILLTGAYCSESTLKRIRSVLTMGNLLNCYGGTEAGGVSGNLSDHKPKSVGKLLPNVQVKIIDSTTGKRLSPHQSGEICISQGYKWSGYYKNPESTKNMLDVEGFIHTGDLGYMDDENYLHLLGRCKDILKFRGWHYSPHEIEGIIAEMPDVIDVCVFGVFDEIRLDVPAAAVVKREGSTLSERDVIKYVESKTEALHKRIQYGVFFVNELTRNLNGKLLRNKIKDICLKMEEAKNQEIDKKKINKCN